MADKPVWPHTLSYYCRRRYAVSFLPQWLNAQLLIHYDFQVDQRRLIRTVDRVWHRLAQLQTYSTTVNTLVYGK